MKKIEILGTKINSLNLEELRANICELLKSDEPNQIVTPNPEFCVEARKDKEFRTILNKAALAIPDGIGLKYASIYLFSPLKQRLTGVETVKELCSIAEEKNKKVYFLGAENEVALQAAKNIKEEYPKLKIVGAENEFSIFGKIKDEKSEKRGRFEKAKW